MCFLDWVYWERSHESTVIVLIDKIAERDRKPERFVGKLDRVVEKGDSWGLP
jgi:hypothetical protein